MTTLPSSYGEVPPSRPSLRWYQVWWRAITRPRLEAYRELLSDSHVGWHRSVLWIAASGLAGGFLSIAVYPGIFRIDWQEGTWELYLAPDLSPLILGAIVFASYVFVQHACASLLGGRGARAQLALLASAYTSPLILLSGLLSGFAGIAATAGQSSPEIEMGFHMINTTLPDTAGWFVGRNLLLMVLLAIFSFVAIRAVYGLQPIRSLAAVLAPTVLSGCTVLSLGGFMWAAQNGLSVAGPAEPASAIYVMNADGTNVRRLTDNTAHDTFPVWSPDGTHIAFVSDRAGQQRIFIMRSDGSEIRQLSEGADGFGALTWSPDGRKIAFASTGRGGFNLYSINADGTGLVQLTDDPSGAGDPAWSPDGHRIAYGAFRSGNEDVYIMDLDGSRQTQLTRYKANDGSPTWAPDGSRIAFGSNHYDIVCLIGDCPDEGSSRIFVVPAAGGEAHAITNGESNDLYPAWSPDGKRIAFISDRDGNDEIYVMDPQGGSQQDLTRDPGTDMFPSWSPDSKQLVFASTRGGQ